MNKKGFTIIEMVMVIFIVWILMLTFKNNFQINNRDKFFGEACINNIYGDINNYMYAAITSKLIFSGTEKVYPTVYYIDFKSSTNSILFSHQKSTGSIVTQTTMTLTGTNIPSNYNCKSNAYNIVLSWWNFQLKINKWLLEDSNLRSMILSGGGNTYFTGEIKFLLTYPNSTGYKELGKFEIDTRIQNIRKTNPE